MYDVIVVGARVAGSPTAMLLARRGYRVLAVDRASFPSDTLSTHYIHQTGLARLRSWGLLDELTETGCPRITEARWHYNGMTVHGFGPAYEDIDYAYCPRRTVLDTLLVRAARAAGAEIREGFTVRNLVTEHGRVVGVRGRSHGGTEEELRAPVVIGADGRRSLVARAGNAAEYKARPPLTVVYYTYWRGLDVRYEMYMGEKQQIGIMPTHGGALLIQAARQHDQFANYRANIEGTYHEIIEQVAPDVAAEISATGQQVERFFGTADLPNFYRKPYGPGWALVGDAGYHKDPLTGQGITDAFRDAELLAAAVDNVLSGRGEWDAELAAYEQARNTASELIYEFTCAAAQLELSERMRAIFPALAADRAEADKFLGLIAGTTSVLDFFAPDHIEALKAAAGALRPAA